MKRTVFLSVGLACCAATLTVKGQGQPNYGSGRAAQALARAGYQPQDSGTTEHSRPWVKVGWQTNRLGQAVWQTNTVVQLLPGGFTRGQGSGTGPWTECAPLLSTNANGSISGDGATFSARFPKDLGDPASAGAVEVTLPQGGGLFRARLIGVAYEDPSTVGGTNVMIGEVQSSQPRLVSSKLLTYPNAISGMNADVSYSYDIGHVSQTITIKSKPELTPEILGLNPTNTRIVAISEVLGGPEPQVDDQTHRVGQSSVPDSRIDFTGAMHLGPGRAFSLRGGRRGSGVFVAKQYLVDPQSHRRYILEEISYPQVAHDLLSLPPSGASTNASLKKPMLFFAGLPHQNGGAKSEKAQANSGARMPEYASLRPTHPVHDERAGVLGNWSDGVLEYWNGLVSGSPVLHLYSTPTPQYSTTSRLHHSTTPSAAAAEAHVSAVKDGLVWDWDLIENASGDLTSGATYVVDSEVHFSELSCVPGVVIRYCLGASLYVDGSLYWPDGWNSWMEQSTLTSINDNDWGEWIDVSDPPQDGDYGPALALARYEDYQAAGSCFQVFYAEPGIIYDGPEVSTVTVSATRSWGFKGSTNNGIFTISRVNGDWSQDLAVNISVGGTATAGVDYQSIGVSATIPAWADHVDVAVVPSSATGQVYQASVHLSLGQGNYSVGACGDAWVSIFDMRIPAPPPVHSPAGLVGWWQGESNALDTAGINHGTMECGSLTFVPGEVGWGFDFNSATSDQRLIVSNSPALNFGPYADFSVEAWVLASNEGTQPIVDKHFTTNGVTVGYQLFLGGGGLTFYLGPYSTYSWTGPNLHDGHFHHVAITVARGSSFLATLFVDGVVVQTWTVNWLASLDLSNTEPLRIGNYFDGWDWQVFKGTIDEVSLYSRALTTNEVQSLYSAGRGGKILWPSIITQPLSQRARVGDDVTLSMVASINPAVSYQWTYNGQSIAGATSSALALTNVQLGFSGNYAVVMSNSVGSVISSNATLTVCVGPPYASAPSGLVGWWKGEGNAVDTAGTNNGSILGNATFAPAEVGRGFVFNGNGSAVQLNNATNLWLQDLTIETWFQRKSSLAVSFNGDYGLIFGNAVDCFGYGFYLDSMGRLTLSVMGWYSVHMDGSITDTNLHHVAVTKSGSVVMFYIDGMVYPAPALNFHFNFSYTSSAYIGSAGIHNTFYGILDELSVYNRALSWTEIQGIYNAGISGKVAAPVLFAQPASQAVMQGGTASFSVSAVGASPLSYQWRFNGANISGATQTSYTLTNAQASQTGSYAVRVTNSYGSAMSGNAVLTVSVPPAAPPDNIPTNILLDSWSFTDINSWASDRGHLPISFTNLNWSDLGDAAALVVDSPQPASLRYHVFEQDGRTNLTVANGSLAFWFAPYWSSTNAGGTGPGQWGRLIEAGSYTTNASYGWWSLYVDPEGANLYFSAQRNDGSQTNYFTAPITWTTNLWHLVVLTYSTTTNCSLYVDGELVANGPPTTCVPGPDVLTNGFYIGSASNGLAQAHGMFDQVQTYANPLDPGTVGALYGWGGAPYYLNPENFANWSPVPFYMTNSPTFRAIMGPGYITNLGPVSLCGTNAHVRITDFTARLQTNGTQKVTFSVTGGDRNAIYDVFGTDRLCGTNVANAQWSWLGQVSTCCQYSINNLPATTACLVLGTPQDSDGDGLTDAYELLVSKTDPLSPDTDGDGIMDWFGVVYFGGQPFDPYAMCTNGDGWTILQAFQNGWNPSDWHTPPPPKNVAVRLDSTGTNATITWETGGGPVTNYTILTGYTFSEVAGQTNANSFNFPYQWPSYATHMVPNQSFKVRAYFVNGDHADSLAARAAPPSLSCSMTTIRGPGGQLYLGLSPIPPELASVRVWWYYYDTGLQEDVWRWLDLPKASFTNGVTPLPLEQMDGYCSSGWHEAQCISSNGGTGAFSWLGEPYPWDGSDTAADWDVDWGRLDFADAQRHLKENLKFLLRSATVTEPFTCLTRVRTGPSGGPPNPSLDYPQFWYGHTPAASNYEYSGYHTFSPSLEFAFEEELRPVRENYLWRNLAYDLADFGSLGQWTNGVDYYTNQPGLRQISNPNYEFTCTNCDPLPLALDLANHADLFARWVPYSDTQQFPNDLAEIGVVVNGDNVALPAGVRNMYGLGLDSVLVYPEGGPAYRLNAGGSSAFWSARAYYFCHFQAPVLQTTNYYFASQTPYFNYGPYDGNGDYIGPAPPLPGSPTFSATNLSPLLITGIGQPITVSGWAKQTIANGYSGKYGYLEQYFTNAWTLDAGGNRTTNSAGLLSPYGEFFPMMPGPAAVITMPDIDTGQQGTGIVNVLKLELDVNHDGLMDLSFGGPDNTSEARPYTHWVNNDCDWATETLSGNPAEVGHDISNEGGYYSDYRSIAIRSQRDLEDYARLWLCGMPSLPANQGYLVTLSLANASTTNFAINLVNAVEVDGGTSYLTDTNIAAAQVTYSDFSRATSPGYKFARLSTTPSLTTSQSYTFPDNYFTNNATKHFLFEGAGVGSGQLVLTISQATAQGTNVIAQTGAWLDLRDVKNMYEQVHISGVTNAVPPTSGFLSSSYQQLNWVDAGSDGDTNIIVFVHGWRMGFWDYENFSESMFKRLYWQGYRGRFISIRWDTLSKDDFNFASTLQSYTTYNPSEYRAWESAKGVSDYLTSLKQRFPNYNLNVCSHSMGGIVMAEALKLQLAAGQHNVNNYVLMQAAVPASCYDTSFTNYAPMLAAEASQPTPNTYLGYPGAISGAVSGHLVDFFNVNDYALATGTIYIPLYGNKPVSWEANQETYKPDTGFGYTTDGTNCFNARQGYRTVTDSHEIMPFCARPRSKAVGAQSGVGGTMQGGAIDLTANYGFYQGSDEHSAQFNWNIQRLSGFYRQLGVSLGVLQPSTP